MRYRTAIDMILQELPSPKDGRSRDNAKRAFRSAQIEANLRNHKGWPHARREGVATFGGSVDDGTVGVTQDSRAVTGTGTAFASAHVGWRLAILTSGSEIYTVASVTDTTHLTLDRPYQGDTDTTASYRLYDPYGILPADYFATESVCQEYGGKKLGEAEFGYVRGLWPKPAMIAGVDYAMLAQPTKSARWTDTAATLAKDDATVVVDGTLPEWIVGRHLRVSNEDTLYKIASRTDDNNLELDRAYGGDNEGGSKTVYIDPPGCYRMEAQGQQEDQYALKLQYFADPEEHVNDSDVIEGGEDFAVMLVEIASAGLLASQKSEVVEVYQNRIRVLQSNGMTKLQALLEGKKVSDEAPVARDYRYAGTRLYK